MCMLIIIDKTEYNSVKLLMNFEKLKRNKTFSVKIASTMRLILNYSFFSAILLLGLSQIACSDIRGPFFAKEKDAIERTYSHQANVSNYVLQSISNGITLTWSNPTDSDFSKVLILKAYKPHSRLPHKRARLCRCYFDWWLTNDV